MQQRMRAILRVVFAITGSLAGLFGIGTLVLVVLLPSPGEHSDALWGSCIYLAIALVSFVAVWRLQRKKSSVRGFEVIPGSGGDTKTG